MTDEVKVLLDKSRWTNPIDLYIGEIIEYDMKSGGLSIIKEHRLLPPNIIKQIESIPKGLERNKFIGNLKFSKDPAVKEGWEKHNDYFAYYRKLLGEANDLELKDIFSIKKDAVFLTRGIQKTTFGNYINFREKHTYDIYFVLGRNELSTNYDGRHREYEVYYNTFNDDISFKGIKDEIINQYHMNGMVVIIKKYLRYISRFDYIGATKYIVKIIDAYKTHQLDISCYREFNDESKFKFQIEGKQFSMDDADDSMLRYIDVRHNFNFILVPMLNMASLGIGRDNR